MAQEILETHIQQDIILPESPPELASAQDLHNLLFTLCMRNGLASDIEPQPGTAIAQASILGDPSRPRATLHVVRERFTPEQISANRKRLWQQMERNALYGQRVAFPNTIVTGTNMYAIRVLPAPDSDTLDVLGRQSPVDLTHDTWSGPQVSSRALQKLCLQSTIELSGPTNNSAQAHSPTVSLQHNPKWNRQLPADPESGLVLRETERNFLGMVLRQTVSHLQRQAA